MGGRHLDNELFVITFLRYNLATEIRLCPGHMLNLVTEIQNELDAREQVTQSEEDVS
jgi:hypothetical protein